MRSCLWISLESTRYDHTSLADGGSTTPFLAALAAEDGSTSLGSCISHDIWTRSSTASILTGLPPRRHGAWHDEAALPNDIRTIPEAFRVEGYRTVGISAIAQFSPSTGLSRGFDEFHEISSGNIHRTAPVKGLIRYITNLRSESAGFTFDTGKHTTGPLNVEIAKKYIRNGPEPLFLYTHLADSHHPYYSPRGYRNEVSNEAPLPVDDALSLTMQVSRNLHETIARQSVTREEMQSLRSLYADCLAFVDDIVAELVRAARKHLENPIIVVTADHGEQFGEDGLLAHMLIPNRAVIHVPMVVSGLDVPESQLVQPADLMAALTNELGVDHPVPVGKDPREHEREFAVTERSGKRARQKLDLINSLGGRFEGDDIPEQDVVSIRTTEWRYETDLSEHEQLRTADEEPAAEPAVAAELHERAGDWSSRYPKRETNEHVDFTDAQREQLRDLGYL